MKRILFIGHDARRTGAPIVLLHLLRWLRERYPDAEFDVLLLRGGEFESDYRRVAEVFVLPEEQSTLLGRGDRWLRRKLGRERRVRGHGLPPFRRDYDVVLGNTIVTLDHLEYFKSKGSRTVCWIHEMEYVIESMFTRERFLELSRSVDCFISASRAVDQTLREFGVTTDSHVVYEISPAMAAPDIDPRAVKRELGFPEDSFLVGGGGTIEWRKGPDLFLQIAAMVSKAEQSINFVWMGGAEPSSVDHIRVRHDLKRLGIEDRIVFTGMTDQPGKYLSAIDVFALTSREDPFPLICLEAASLGKPIICFERAGGMPEFVVPDTGVVVPYIALDVFSEQVINFCHDPGRVVSAGANAREKLNSSFSPDKQCKAIEQVLLTYQNCGGPKER